MPCRRPRRELRSPFTAPTASSGTLASSSMIGSRRTGSALIYASFQAIEPAILNAISDESTVWYEPSTSSTRTPCTGAPASSPWCIASWIPLSTAGRKLCGMTPPTILSTNSYSISGRRRDDDVAVAELATSAGLFLVAPVGARLAADRLAVRDARRMQLDVDAEPALRALERDLDVHLAHPREDLLARLLVAPQPQRRVLFREPADRRCDLLLVALRLGRDREAHDRLGEAEVGASIATSLSARRSPVCASFSLATEPRSPSPKSWPEGAPCPAPRAACPCAPCPSSGG